MPDSLAVPLSDCARAEAARIGAKALNLARLLQDGLPVPDGFCIPVEAYRAHLASPRVVAALVALDSPAERAPLLALLRREITEAPIADAATAAIHSAYARLGAAAVAVRSSGTAEDLPGHSFAGQYDSFLEPADAGHVLLLVRRCWASLWTERAYDYRRQNGFDHRAAGMAVIVQRLVAADAAGVAFTADPVSGRRDRVVIEAVAGLGDKLVSGEATPDRFVLARTRFGVTARPASPRPAIDDRAARTVGQLATRAERLFGSPQDVEWAIAGGRTWLLQARPITTLKERAWADRQVWSNSNAAEVLPGVLAPMVWSTVGDYVGELLGGVVARIGISFGEHPLFAPVAGRLYMNLNTFTGMVRRMPFAGRMSQAQMFGGQGLSPEDRARLELGPDDLPDINLSPLKTLLKVPGFLGWILRHGPGRGRRWIAAARTAYDAKPRTDPSRLAEAELVARTAATLRQFGVGGEGLGYALAGMMYTSVLYDLCRRWFGDKTGSSASRLLAGTGELQSAEAGVDLWRLARSAPGDVRRILLAPGAWPEVRAQLAGTEAGRGFLDRWDLFLHRHGHHARGEMDMYNPRWREQPDYILEVVRNFLRAGEAANPEADQRRHAAEFERLRAELLARLRNPFKRLLFGHVVRQARLSAAIRENVKDAAIRIIADTRELLVEIGRRLAARGVIAQPDDIFFLRIEELEPAAAGTAGFDVRARIAGRRAEHEQNLALNPPAVIIGPYDPARHAPDRVDPTARVLAGLAVSPGRVTGPARVILHAGDG